MKNPTKLVILILSKKNNEERRQSQKATWLKNINIPYYFILGGKGKFEGDIIYANSNDDNLPRKLISAYQCIIDKYEFDYIFTCDDDTYVVVDRLLRCGYEDHMYMGTRWKDHAEGGAGFFLSRESIERFSQIPLDHPILTGPSDEAIGKLAKMYTIHLHEDDRFVQGYSDKKRHGGLPMPSNDQITSHYLDPELLQKVHAQFTHQYWKKMIASDLKSRQLKAIL